jgi:uncharacterized membrane protein YjjP (DUF1212 family)
MVANDDSAPEAPEDCLHVKAEVVLRAGKLALSAGFGAYRVKQVMSTVAKALGIENTAHVTLTEITSTCHDHSDGKSLFNTEVATIKTVGVDSNRITELQRFANRLEVGNITHEVNCIDEELTRIEEMPRLYRSPVKGLWAAIACFGFTFLIGGDIFEMLGAFVGAFFGQLIRGALLKRHYNQFVTTVLAVLVGELAYLGISSIFAGLGLVSQLQSSGYVGALLFIIPGFPLVTGGLDLAKLDFSSGVFRTFYALTIILYATIVGWVFASLIGFVPGDLVSNYQDLGPWFYCLRLICSFLGVLGFALLFNSKWKLAVFAASIGMVCNFLRLLLIDNNLPPFVAALIAATLAGLLATFASKVKSLDRHFGWARTTVTVPAIVIMIPGSQIFRAIYELGTENISTALYLGFKAFLAIFALPIGLAIARFITDKDWRQDN